MSDCIRGFRIILNRNDANVELKTEVLEPTLQNHCVINPKKKENESLSQNSEIFLTNRRYSSLENITESQKRIRRLILMLGQLNKKRTIREKVFLLNTNYEDRFLGKIRSGVSRSSSSSMTHATTRKTGRYHCLFCFKDFSNENLLNDHVIRHIEKKPSFYCAHCSASYYHKNSICIHLNKCHNKVNLPHHCHKCNRTFSNSTSLQLHEENHNKAKQYQCRFCFRRFHTERIYKRHEHIYHDLLLYTCNICSEKFSSNVALMMHKTKSCNSTTLTSLSDEVSQNQDYELCCIHIKQSDVIRFLNEGQSFNVQEKYQEFCSNSFAINLVRIDEILSIKKDGILNLSTSEEYFDFVSMKLSRINNFYVPDQNYSSTSNFTSQRVQDVNYYSEKICKPFSVKLVRIDETPIFRKLFPLGSTDSYYNQESGFNLLQKTEESSQKSWLYRNDYQCRVF